MESTKVKQLFLTYAICVSKQTSIEWKEIVDILFKKYQKDYPKIFIYESDFFEFITEFRKSKPKYTCFIAQPSEISPNYYKSLHSFVKKIDENSIFASTIFAVLTGPDLETVIKIASLSEPLVINTVLSGTQLNLAPFKSGWVYSEMTCGLKIKKQNFSEPEEALNGPSDPIKTIVDHLNENSIDLMVTSGHATEHDWRLGFGYPAGFLTFEKDTNDLIAKDLNKDSHKIQSTNPKVYVGCGNCLIGNIKNPYCMALSWMKSAFSVQFVGYTVPTWFGFAGWGLNKYFIETPGYFTLSEAYFANLQVLNYYCHLYQKKIDSYKICCDDKANLCNLCKSHKKDKKFLKGLIYDSDALILYGDPRWSAKILNQNTEDVRPYDMKLVEIRPNCWEFQIICKTDCIWECPSADDHFTIPGRPPIFIFEERKKGKLNILKGDLIITDLFVMMIVIGNSKKGEVHIGIFEELEKEEEIEK